DLRDAAAEPHEARSANDMAVLSRRRAWLHASQGAGGESGGDRDRLAPARRLPAGLPVVTPTLADRQGLWPQIFNIRVSDAADSVRARIEMRRGSETRLPQL